MTERKTTEIKIRVTPSFKARVQGAADAAGVSLTEWLEGASVDRIAAGEFVTINRNAFGENILAAYDHPAKSWMYEGKGG